MDSTILAAIIGSLGTIGAAIVSVMIVPSVRSKSFRSRHNIPDILGTWNNQWFIGDEPYVEDTFELEKWTRKNKFQGKGINPRGPYNISGEISSSRVLVATYIDTEFPTMDYIGIFILRLAVDGKSMGGYWHGITSDGNINGGKVSCKRP